MFFNEKGSYQDIDWRIQLLKEKFEFFTSGIHTPSTEEWESLFDEIKDLHEDFKTVRYPKKIDRDDAWERFFKLRNKSYEARKEFFEKRSKDHLGDLERMSNDLMVPTLATTIAEFRTDGMKELREEMKENGRKLKETIHHYSAVKQEMTKKDQLTIREWFSEIRYDHDAFLGEVHLINVERREIRQQKQEEYEDRKRLFKERVEENIRKNEDKLEKAKDALERFEIQKDNLKDKIASACTDSFRERHETWLDEVNEKIDSVESQISRLESWIREDEEKL